MDEKTSFKKSLYKENATFKKKIKVEINRWALFITLLVFLIVWINISEYFGYLRHSLPKDEFEVWNKTDGIVMVVLMLLTFTSFFLDLIGNLKVVRFLLALPFNRTQLQLIIVLTNGVEYALEVKNKKEAMNIISALKIEDRKN